MTDLDLTKGRVICVLWIPPLLTNCPRSDSHVAVQARHRCDERDRSVWRSGGAGAAPLADCGVPQGAGGCARGPVCRPPRRDDARRARVAADVHGQRQGTGRGAPERQDPLGPPLRRRLDRADPVRPALAA